MKLKIKKINLLKLAATFSFVSLLLLNFGIARADLAGFQACVATPPGTSVQTCATTNLNAAAADCVINKKNTPEVCVAQNPDPVGSPNQTPNPSPTPSPSPSPSASGSCPAGLSAGPGGVCLPPSTCTTGICGSKTIVDLLLNVIKILLGLAGIVAVAIVVVGGFWYMTSGGNEEQAEKGKKTILNFVLGLAVIILSYTIVTIISDFISSDKLTK